MPVLKPQDLIDDRINAIRAFHEQAGIPKAEIDISGGIDSAVMAILLGRTLGPGNVVGVYSSIQSSEDSRERAYLTAESVGIPLVDLELGDIFDLIVTKTKTGLSKAGFNPDHTEARCATDATIHGSLRSTLRAPIGRFVNRMVGGGVRHGTGNECEDRWLRFYQKGGDGEVDTNPLAMLSKGEVYQLALALDVPDRVLRARPSPDLWASGETGHNDEDEIAEYLGVPPDLGVTMYSYIDFETGQYLGKDKVGLIERVSRWVGTYRHTTGLFECAPADIPELVREACRAAPFAGISSESLQVVLPLVRKTEIATRHKFNPNIPNLGTRMALLEAGILTDTLPV
jgi:NAD+ synthetase